MTLIVNIRKCDQLKHSYLNASQFLFGSLKLCFEWTLLRESQERHPGTRAPILISLLSESIYLKHNGIVTTAEGP